MTVKETAATRSQLNPRASSKFGQPAWRMNPRPPCLSTMRQVAFSPKTQLPVLFASSEHRSASLRFTPRTPLSIVLNADSIACVEADGAYEGNSVAVVKTQFRNIRVPARDKNALAEAVVQAMDALQVAHLTRDGAAAIPLFS